MKRARYSRVRQSQIYSRTLRIRIQRFVTCQTMIDRSLRGAFRNFHKTPFPFFPKFIFLPSFFNVDVLIRGMKGRTDLTGISDGIRRRVKLPRKERGAEASTIVPRFSQCYFGKNQLLPPSRKQSHVRRVRTRVRPPSF